MSRSLTRTALFFIAVVALTGTPGAQAPAANAKAAVHAKQVKRLLIKNAMILPGPAVPAYGPADILSEDGVIT